MSTTIEGPKVSEFECGIRMTVWPAFTYIECTDLESPIRIDEGMTVQSKKVPGVAVPFPARNYDELHKHFRVIEHEDGRVSAVALPVTISDTPEMHTSLAAARIGARVEFKGRVFRLREAPNRNLDLVPEDAS
jgi:hypothetical protein